MRRAPLAIAVGFAGLLAVPAGAQAPATLSLDAAIARAMDANRTIGAARLGRAIDLASIRVAGQRPNPAVSVEAERETPHWSFGGSLPLETAGKRARRTKAAEASLAVTEADIARVTVEIRSEVRRAYYTAVAAAEQLAVDRDLEAIATRARDAARERFQAGAAPRLEPLQAELALAAAQNETVLGRAGVTAARSVLNALLAYPIDAAPVLSDSLEAGPIPTQASLTALALANNADLRVLTRQVDEARARVSLARAMRRPDPAVQGTFTYDADPEFTYGWRLGFAVALPVFTTGRPEVAVAEGTLNKAIADREARAAQIGGEVAAALARASAAREALARYQSQMLPSLQQVEQMAEESYRSGQTGIAALLQTLQSARALRLRALQAGLDYQTAIVELERALGRPLQ